jgi:hypothetical protein
MLKRMAFSLLFFGLVFSGCDEDDLAVVLPDIDIAVNETEEIPVFVQKTDGDWVQFSETTNLTIVNNDTQKYLNKIKKVKIKRLRYRVLAFQGDPNGEVQGSFSADNGKTFQNQFMVKKAFDDQSYYEVQDTDELNRIANALKSKNTIQVRYSGMALCDQDDLDFILEVEYEVEVTVNP